MILQPTENAYTVTALIILGLGWNLGVVGGSLLLTQSSAPETRQHLEALGEIVMGIGAATGAPLVALAITF